MPTETEGNAGLHVLHCPNCGGEVPFEASPEVACIHCGGSVPVPEEHVRAAREADARARQGRMAAGTWRKVTSGGVPAAVIGAVKVWALLAGVSVLAPGLILMAQAGENDRHLLPFMVWFAVAELAFAVYAAVVVQETSRNVAVSTWWGSLGAAPLEGVEGICRCRSCGGMMRGTAQDIVISCAYCGRDNLVGLPPERIKGLMDRSRHSRLSFEAAAQALTFRRDERWLYFLTQFLLAQMVMLPMLARGLEDILELGWVGPAVAFAVAFAAMLGFGFGVSMRKINRHLAATLALWKEGDERSEAFIVPEDYMLVVLGDAGALLDTPTAKAFVPADSIERARFASLQMDFVWREAGKRRRKAFNSRGGTGRLFEWAVEKAGADKVHRLQGDSVSVGRAVVNGIVGLAIVGWAVGMFLL